MKSIVREFVVMKNKDGVLVVPKENWNLYHDIGYRYLTSYDTQEEADNFEDNTDNDVDRFIQFFK